MGTGAYDLSSAFWDYFAPDIVTPEQWSDGHRRTVREPGIKELYCAMFEQFLADYQHVPFSRKTPVKQDEYRRLERGWVEHPGDGAFAFPMFAEMFNLDLEYFREAVIRYMDRVDRGECIKLARRSPVYDMAFKVVVKNV